jgi:hypothetical protein
MNEQLMATSLVVLWKHTLRASWSTREVEPELRWSTRECQVYQRYPPHEYVIIIDSGESIECSLWEFYLFLNIFKFF